MKAITLTQPWATLVAIGAKKIETRSWATKYRGPLAIHAGMGLGPVGGKRGFADIYSSEPFRSVLLAAMPGGMRFSFGAIIATCVIDSVIPTTWLRATGRTTVSGIHGPTEYVLDDQERLFGDYTDGRYAWLLADVKMLPEPIPAKGALSLWDWGV
jgi:activating signal cointegrator 1